MCVAIGLVLFAIPALSQQHLLQGLNHTPIVVSNLEQAVADFRAMGFTIKPGHLHPDGLRNAHVKFADETELELITAPAGVDDLTREYRNKLRSGDGPVYFGLDTPDPASLLRKARAAGLPLTSTGGLLTFPADHPLHAIFFGALGPAPNDRPEYFAHANTAIRLSAFWVRDSTELRDLFRLLNVPLLDSPSCGALPGRVTEARLPRGSVFLVSEAGPTRILGARVEVRSLSVAASTLRRAGLNPQTFACDKASLWLPPSAAHGIWLEFTQSTQ